MPVRRSGKRLTAGQQALVEEHLHLADRAARVKAARCYHALADDLRSAARMGLVEAALTFDPSRGCTFHTHLLGRVEGAMSDHLRGLGLKGFRRKKVLPPRSVSLELPAAGADDPSPIRDLIADGRGEVGEELEAVDAVESMARLLPRSERRAVTLYYTRAGTARMRDVAREMGLSPPMVSLLITSGLSRLRRRYRESQARRT